ncbi:ATP-binding protein [Gammaproteobacteria bacterium]
MISSEKFDVVVPRLASLLDRVEALLPIVPAVPDFGTMIAFRWRKTYGRGHLYPVCGLHALPLSDLLGIDDQKSALDRNTRQFVHGLPANNALLWGARGTGKSSLIKALLTTYGSMGLRLVEVDKHDLVDLPDIMAALEGRKERFILYCDDLSFSADELGYQALKAMLDGSVAAPPENMVIYATSNRRHLLPEYLSENREARMVDGEIHQSDAVEEKISLSERFGLWLSFYPFRQEQYLEIVNHWLIQLGVGRIDDEVIDAEEVRDAALRWALAHGSRSGRSAWQFARDWVGRQGLARLSGTT